VLADGVISEQGSHDELMTLSGLYARLFTRQAEGYTQELAESTAASGG